MDLDSPFMRIYPLQLNSAVAPARPAHGVTRNGKGDQNTKPLDCRAKLGKPLQLLAKFA